MNVLKRSMKNLVRSPMRTVMVIIILAASTGLALTMLTVYGASQSQINNITSELNTNITVRPAGSFGFMGGETLLSEDNVASISQIAHITDVQKSVTARYTGTSMVAANPFSGQAGVAPPPDIAGVTGGRSFRMNIGITAIGVDPANTSPALQGGATIESISSGRYFNTSENDANVMVIGSGLATANSLVAGSSVDIEGIQMEVIGIFESGQVFGNNILLLPTDTIMRVFGLSGYSEVIATVDTLSNVSGVTEAIKSTLGADKVDVISPEDRFQAMSASLSSASKTGEVGTIAAIAVAIIVIVVAIVLTMRQRVKEIGILKAVGASNGYIALGFGVETLFTSLVSVGLGTLLAIPLVKVVSGLLTDTGPTITQAGANFPGGGAPGFAIRNPGGPFGERAVIGGLNVAVSPEILLYALGLVVLLAVAASLFPTYYIARVKPAEVLRSE